VHRHGAPTSGPPGAPPGASTAAGVGFGFGRARRLQSRREILAVQHGGSRVHTSHFLLIVGRGPVATAASRLGITVTRKVGDSVRRNRVKRLVREAFRLAPAMLPPGIDLLVIAKAGAPLLGLAQVQSEWSSVRSLLERRAREVLSARAPLTGAPPMTTKPQ